MPQCLLSDGIIRFKAQFWLRSIKWVLILEIFKGNVIWGFKSRGGVERCLSCNLRPS